MDFDPNARLLALATAYRALAIALFQNGALTTDLFEANTSRGIARLEAIGALEASNAMAELVEPIIADFRRIGPTSGG